MFSKRTPKIDFLKNKDIVIACSSSDEKLKKEQNVFEIIFRVDKIEQILPANQPCDSNEINII